MRKEKRWRYFCEYCNRSGGHAHYMAKHERGCTKNPNRVCGLCQADECAQEPLHALVQTLDVLGMQALRGLASDCPACILAALRNSKVSPETIIDDAEHEARRDFDYRAEAKKWWQRVNETRQEAGCY